MRKYQARLKLFKGNGDDRCFLECLREPDRVGCRKHIKVKAQTRAPFCWFLFDSEKLWQSGETEG